VLSCTIDGGYEAFTGLNFDAEHELGPELYEDQYHAIEPASDADMLRHLLEARGVTQAQLSRDTLIPKSTISEVLAGKKPFSRQMIRKFANYFKVDVSVLATNL
jgi:HTH-type transcriptional regulator/antitoxin HigA